MNAQILVSNRTLRKQEIKFLRFVTHQKDRLADRRERKMFDKKYDQVHRHVCECGGWCSASRYLKLAGYDLEFDSIQSCNAETQRAKQHLYRWAAHRGVDVFQPFVD